MMIRRPRCPLFRFLGMLGKQDMQMMLSIEGLIRPLIRSIMIGLWNENDIHHRLMQLNTRVITIDRHMRIHHRLLEDIMMNLDMFDRALLSIIMTITNMREDVLRHHMLHRRIIRVDIPSGSTERITRGITIEKEILKGTRLKKEAVEGAGVLWQGISGRIERGEDMLEVILVLAVEGSEGVEQVEVLRVFLLLDRCHL